MEEKKEMLLAYIKNVEIPILEDFIFGEDFPKAVVIPASIPSSELVGHYEGTEYVPPKWYSACADTEAGEILVIDNIDSISLDDQLKFRELLEARKISTFELPDNTAIVVTAKKISKETINEEIFSLVALI